MSYLSDPYLTDNKKLLRPENRRKGEIILILLIIKNSRKTATNKNNTNKYHNALSVKMREEAWSYLLFWLWKIIKKQAVYY